MQKLIQLSVYVVAVGILVGVVLVIYRSMPPAKEAVATEMARIKGACARGDTKACEYLTLSGEKGGKQ